MWFPVLIPELEYLLIGISTILLGIFVDLGFGIAEAIKRKEFQWYRVVNFLEYNVLPYAIVWGLLSVIPVAMIYWKFSDLITIPLVAFSTVAFSFIIGELLTSIWGHIKAVGFKIDEPETMTLDEMFGDKAEAEPLPKVAPFSEMKKTALKTTEDEKQSGDIGK